MDAHAQQATGWLNTGRATASLAAYRAFAEPSNETRLSSAELWRALSHGEYQILESGYTDEQCLARLCRVRRPCPMKRARVEILRRVLLGDSPKLIAFEHGVAVSSVTGACSDCLSAMGAGRWTSRAPIWLSMAAHASVGRGVPDPELRPVLGAAPHTLTLGFPRPDLDLERRLTRAECVVARRYLEGDSHVSIARYCHSAPRTVANQLASVFRKLCVSGRGDLLSWLIREQWPG